MTEGLYAELPPAWVEEIPVLGLRVRFESTDDMLHAAVGRAFGGWRALPAHLVAERRVTVRLVAHDGDEGVAEHAPLTYRSPDRERLLVLTPGSVGCADVRRAEVIAYVSRQLAADTEHFRYGVVEALTYFLLSQLDRQPFHCAALVRNGRVVLLSGPPGVGKSTLAYAGLSRGFQVMGEDMVWIEQHPRFRVWGTTPVIQLPPDVTRYFPSLASAPTLVANGQRKIAVEVGPGSGPVWPVADEGIVCVLERGNGPARLMSITKEEVSEALAATLCSGFDLFPTTIPAVVAALADRGGWRLSMGESPMDAVDCLEELPALREKPAQSAVTRPTN